MELVEGFHVCSSGQKKFSLGSLAFGAESLLNSGWWANTSAITTDLDRVRAWVKEACNIQDLLLSYERLRILKLALDKAGYPYLFQQEFLEAKALVEQGTKKTGASTYKKIVDIFGQIYCTELMLRELARSQEAMKVLTS